MQGEAIETGEMMRRGEVTESGEMMKQEATMAAEDAIITRTERVMNGDEKTLTTIQGLDMVAEDTIATGKTMIVDEMMDPGGMAIIEKKTGPEEMTSLEERMDSAEVTSVKEVLMKAAATTANLIPDGAEGQGAEMALIRYLTLFPMGRIR